jgi:hypothetical protein
MTFLWEMTFLLRRAMTFMSSVLSQYGEDGRLHPIAYRSRKFSTVEINYKIHNKELLAIIDAF